MLLKLVELIRDELKAWLMALSLRCCCREGDDEVQGLLARR